MKDAPPSLAASGSSFSLPPPSARSRATPSGSGIVDRSRQREVEPPQAQDGEHVAREYQEWIARDREDGRDRVDREDEVGRLTITSASTSGVARRSHGGPAPQPGRLRRRPVSRPCGERGPARTKKCSPWKRRSRKEPPGQADHKVAVRVRRVRLQQEHLNSGHDQERAEHVDDPGER